eukprot:COSAG05_NODE_1036_length_6076_cov_159.776476_6_plen_77_part_00
MIRSVQVQEETEMMIIRQIIPTRREDLVLLLPGCMTVHGGERSGGESVDCHLFRKITVSCIWPLLRIAGTFSVDDL